MATSYKILGQSAPSATTPADLYTVPSATEAVISTIAICNRGAAAGSFRISLRPNGAAQANQHYIAFDTAIGAKETIFLSLGATLDAADVVTVYASSADFSFNLSGSEIA